MHCSMRSTTTGHSPKWKQNLSPTSCSQHLVSTAATTPSDTSQRGPVVVSKPSPGSRDRASASRRVHPQSCGPSSPQDCGCTLLDALARSLDPGDGLLTTTGPRCDVSEGVVAAVDTKC